MTSQFRTTAQTSYRRLVRTRLLVAVAFTAINVVSYMGFQLCISFAPEFLAVPVFDRLSMTVGILWGTAQVELAIVLVGAYLLISNMHLDKLEQTVRDGLD